MLDDTILLFTSDHGCHFKTRNDEYKRSCHEASIRVPTFLRGPGFAAGSEPARLVSLIDLPPTLLDAAGMTPPAQMQDHSILAKGGPDDIFIQISESHVGRALRTRRWKYEMIADDTDGWDDMDCDSYREAFLYDLDADPHELVNLIGRRDLAEVRAMLRARLLDRMAMAGEARPRVLPVVDAAMKVTLQEIACRVGVAEPTVSRVLSKEPTLSISEEKRRAVIETAEELNYVRVGRRPALVSRHRNARTIMLVHELTADDELSRPFYVGLRKGVEAAALEHGATLVRANPASPPSLGPREALLGCIVIGTLPAAMLAGLMKLDVPLVFADQSAPTAGTTVS